MTLESLKTLTVTGRIFSGCGQGAKFIELPWGKKQITEKLGFIPYPGTLNIKITSGNVSLKLLKKAKAIDISPPEGFCRGKCFKIRFMDSLECAIVIPEVENYPEDLIEVIAPVSLRERFQLKNGDVVKVKIML